jgi:hypothetical protein
VALKRPSFGTRCSHRGALHIIKGGSSLGVAAFGCLRSLRARLALDGVSWVQRGSVEIAVGQRLASATQCSPSSAPSLGRRSSWELVSASCFVGLGRCELRSVSQHRMHDDSEAARQSDSRLRIVDRLAIAKAQSLSLSWPL